MIFLSFQLATGFIHVAVLEQSITLNWSGYQNLFGRHLNIETIFGTLMLSTGGIVLRKRLHFDGAAGYKTIYSRGDIARFYS